MMPAPYFSDEYCWFVGLRAVFLRIFSTASGSVTPSPTTSAATPAACGEAIEVPMNA